MCKIAGLLERTKGGKNGANGVVSDLVGAVLLVGSKPFINAGGVVTCFSFTILLQ